ncbi:NB-ARC domain, LRR domain containing protein [Trema orientale]|uniref:NB-ARC domain, LRR domain containing protein n=1 Tax=Trema orientale TaxID=63057 RepID=A0A2P5DBN1_TREOI|nr:NB-ARC domain, LRR domain containing protein [Trema orientale]
MLFFLRDAGSKQEQDERVRNWVAEVRDVALDVEDVVESFIVQVSSSPLLVKGFCLQKLRTRIKFLQTRIDDILRSTQRYRIEFASGEGTSYVAELRRSLRRSYPSDEDEDDDVVIGLVDSFKALKDELMKQEDRLCVVSVVGMGGLGKTTLAKRVYNHSDVRQHFDCRAWVFISQQFVPRDVLYEILTQVGRENEREISGNLKDHHLIVRVRACLKGKRYLVVLDDVWRTEAWNSIKSAFPKGKKGSKVLFTTRNKEVALSANPWSSLVEPSFLTFEESWELLRRKAFPRYVVSKCGSPLEFEKLGKEMVKNCGGLPLAIVVLGGLLSTKNSLEGWEKVLRDVSSRVSRQCGVEEILALSYNDLPYYLKPCFLYIGSFPEDLEIPKRKLIRLWIAEGFVPTPSEGEVEETMEDIAEQYLGELIDRCMVQVNKMDYTGMGVKTCRMHDLMREFCVSKAREDNFFEIIQNEINKKSPGSSSFQHFPATRSRRISVHLGQCLDYSALSFEQVHPHLRSLLCFATYSHSILPLKNKSFRLLRVLELGQIRGALPSQMPREIGNLIHLRYLGLKSAKIVNLPHSIGNLRNLHTLDLRNNDGIRMPRAVSGLIRLRYLLLPYGGYTLSNWRRNHFRMDKLTNIETLKYIECKDLIKYDAHLKLTNLRNLVINVKSEEDLREVLEYPVVASGQLRTLAMSMPFDNAFPSLESLSQCLLLSKLFLKGKIQNDFHSCPILHFLPPSLNKLVLSRSEIKQDGMLILEKLPNLRFLQLGDLSCIESKMVCFAQGFPKLETLKLIGLRELQEWQIEKGAMPSLKRLDIYRIPKLMMIPEGLRFISSLRELNVRMSSSFVDRIRLEDGTEGEDFYKVRHIPSLSSIAVGW